MRIGDEYADPAIVPLEGDGINRLLDEIRRDPPPVRAIVIATPGGTRFRVNCPACSLRITWYELKADAQAAADLHNQRVHGAGGARARRRRGPNVIEVVSATSDEIYDVLVGPYGAVCSCPAAMFRRDCWHVAYVEGRYMTTEERGLEVIRIEPRVAVLPTRDELTVISAIAKMVTGAVGVAVPKSLDTPGKRAAVMLTGLELGVKPMTALRRMLIVDGKVEPDGQLMQAIVQAHEPDARFDVVELDEEHCTMRFRRPSRRTDVEYTVEIADAQRAGLIKPGSGWMKYPKDMLRLHATKRLCRIYAADVINSVGVNIAEAEATFDALDAAGETTIEGDVIDLDDAELYNAGDSADAAVVDEDGLVVDAAGRVVDPETGEVVEEPEGVIVETEEHTHTEEQLRESATHSEAPVAESAGPGVGNEAEKGPDSAEQKVAAGDPEPTTDPRLGRFGRVAELLTEARELGFNLPAVRKIAGMPDSRDYNDLLGFEGGLDGLWQAVVLAAGDRPEASS